MPIKMTVNLAHRPEGDDVDIPGLGTFKNGGTYDITDEQEARFQEHHTVDEGKHDSDPQSNTAGAWLPDRKSGPALHEANIHGVTFVRTNDSPNKPQAVKATTKGPVGSAGTAGSQGAASDKGGDS